jgi:phage tail-like protein
MKMKPNEIAHLLPGIFQRTLRPENPLSALLDVMDGLNAIPEETLDHLDAFFNPYRTPDRFVPFLADWVDLEWLLVQSPGERLLTGAPPLPSGLGRLRELVAASAALAKKRGTARGLVLFLETATGIPGFVIQENESCSGEGGQPAPAKPRPFHLCICAPKASLPYRVLIERIIEFEKPAYVTYDLIFISGSE